MRGKVHGDEGTQDRSPKRKRLSLYPVASPLACGVASSFVTRKG